MTLRSPSRGEYAKRMAIVILLCLSVYSIIVSETGGGVFEVWRPERMRLALIALILSGIAAHEFRPGKGRPKDEKTALPLVDKRDSEEPVAETPSGEAPAAEVSTVEVPTEKTFEAGQQPKPQPAAPDLNPAVEAAVVPEKASEQAEALWDKARSLPHGFVPDEVEDGEYLALVREAAALGHVEAVVKLGDYAFRRGWIVEAFYWTVLAQLHGAKGLESALGEMRKTWAKEGCPPEYENVSPCFSEMQGSFARAVLNLMSGSNVARARGRLRELADQGCTEARLFLLSRRTLS